MILTDKKKYLLSTMTDRINRYFHPDFMYFSTNGLVCGKYVKHNYLKLNEDGTVLLSDSEIQEQPDMETEPELPPIYELTLEDVKSNKISQLSSECRKQIVGGVDVLIDNAAEHFFLYRRRSDEYKIPV